MSVMFESTVKNSDDGGWYIELRDTIIERVEICKDLEEFEKMIVEMSQEYGGRVDEVKWISDPSLSPLNMQKVRVSMMEYHEKYKDQLETKEEE